MIRLGEVSRAQLRVLARYSTEFPCLLKGIVTAGEYQAEAFRGFTLHIVLETLPNQPRPYGPQDKPELGEDRGPSCINLPTPPGSQSNPVRRQPDFKDGVDEPTGKGTSRAATGYAGPGHEHLRDPGLRRQHRGGRPAPRPARAGPGRDRRPTCRTSGCCSWARWRAAPRCRSASRRGVPREAPRQEDQRRPDQAAHLHRRHDARDGRARGRRSATSRSAPRRPTRPSSSTRPAWSRATTSGSPASRSAASRTSRSRTAPGRW